MESIDAKLKVVWAVSERAARTVRTRVGVAWRNADGSLSVRLDAVPMSGRLEVRDWIAPVEVVVEGSS